MLDNSKLKCPIFYEISVIKGMQDSLLDKFEYLINTPFYSSFIFVINWSKNCKKFIYENEAIIVIYFVKPLLMHCF